MCSYIIDLKVIFNFNIEDIQLIPGSKLGLLGLLLGSLDQDLLRLFLFLDELALPAGSIGLHCLGGCSARLRFLLFGILFLLFFFLVFFFIVFDDERTRPRAHLEQALAQHRRHGDPRLEHLRDHGASEQGGAGAPGHHGRRRRDRAGRALHGGDRREGVLDPSGVLLGPVLADACLRAQPEHRAAAAAVPRVGAAAAHDVHGGAAAAPRGPGRDRDRAVPRIRPRHAGAHLDLRHQRRQSTADLCVSTAVGVLPPERLHLVTAFSIIKHILLLLSFASQHILHKSLIL